MVAYTAGEDGLWLCRNGKGWTRLMTTGPAEEAGATGPGGDAGMPGAHSLARVTAEPDGANCAAGGLRVEVGVDLDGSGTLSAAEVDPVSYVCDGCAPESDAAFCERLGTCGPTSGVDACNTPRTAHCRCGELLDPQFLQAPPAWQVEGSAPVDPGVSMVVGGTMMVLGAGRLEGSALSADHFGRRFQEVRMPAPADTGPNAVGLAVGIRNSLVTLRGGAPSAVFPGVGSRCQAAGGLVSRSHRTQRAGLGADRHLDGGGDVPRAGTVRVQRAAAAVPLRSGRPVRPHPAGFRAAGRRAGGAGSQLPLSYRKSSLSWMSCASPSCFCCRATSFAPS